MTRRTITALAVCAPLALGVAACGGSGAVTGGDAASSRSVALNGAGATFPQPLYSEWAADFDGATVNYQGIGSGGGIAQLTQGTVDFGATDAAMTDEELAAASQRGAVLHVPTVLGAVTVAYDVDGVGAGLKLGGATLGDIFLGRVRRWNDPALARLNPGVELPDAPITVCHRSDASGTTANFTLYLGAYSPAWRDGPGSDKSVRWPTGTGAKGNDGVARCIASTPGAIGYVEQAYALQSSFTTAAVENKAGAYVAPTLHAASAAGEGVRPPADLRFATIDAPGPRTYPITAITFLLTYRDPCEALGMDAAKARALRAWLEYAYGPGQEVAAQLAYAPLPAQVKRLGAAKIASLQCDGRPVGAADGR